MNLGFQVHFNVFSAKAREKPPGMEIAILFSSLKFPCWIMHLSPAGRFSVRRFFTHTLGGSSLFSGRTSCAECFSPLPRPAPCYNESCSPAIHPVFPSGNPSFLRSIPRLRGAVLYCEFPAVLGAFLVMPITFSLIILLPEPSFPYEKRSYRANASGVSGRSRIRGASGDPP